MIVLAARVVANPALPVQGAGLSTTRAVIREYFDRLQQHRDWQPLFAEGVVYVQYTSPARKVEGKPEFVEATRRFYASVVSVDVRNVLIDGNNACVTTRYLLRDPRGNTIESDVAELFEVRDGKVSSFAIYFDTAPFPK